MLDFIDRWIIHLFTSLEDEDRLLPLRDWVDTIVNWLVTEQRDVFQAIKQPVAFILDGLDDILLWIPELIIIGAIVALAWWLGSRGLAVFSLLALLLIGSVGVWEDTMTTLAMIATAVIICTIIGVPLGITAARSDAFDVSLRPVLDTMQTTPPFVYLIPVVMLFSIGTVSGVIATIIFALPPIIRLTNLGIRQVNREVVEAAYAFGSTPRQVLLEVQVPLALRTIMAGLNQTLMLALSMVVIASIIDAGGLGDPVRVGLNTIQPGIGFIGGMGIVLLAIILDRITQAVGSRGVS